MSHRLLGRGGDPEVEAERAKIGRVVGSRPVECPWWSLARPEVQEIAHMHRGREHAMFALPFGGLDRMPSRLAAGLADYNHAILSAREHFDRLERQNRKGPGAGVGAASSSVKRLGLPPPVIQRGGRGGAR